MKHIKHLAATVAMLLGCITVSAYDFEVDGIFYNITNRSSFTVEVTDDYNASYGTTYSGDVVIPKTVTYNGAVYTVTSIEDYAFYDCSSLTSVTLPESVTSIGRSAFCGGVKEVVLKSTTPPTLTSSGLTNYAILTVPKSAYNDYCTATYWSDLLANIAIDDAEARVKNLTLEAADDKSSLQVAVGDDKLRYVTDLTISGTINSYDFMVMRNKMPVLRHIDLSNASIVHNDYEHYTGHHTEDNVFPQYALHNCILFTLVLPRDITEIDDFSVYGHDCLNEIIIPEGVTSIGEYAFCGCSSLTSVTIPESVTSIGGDAFHYCPSLKSVVLPPMVETIASSTFSSCSSLTSITIPENSKLTSIGYCAFIGCDSLKSVVLPPTVETIDGRAFERCSSLTEIRIPSSVRTVGSGAFDECSNLNDIYVYTVEPISIGQYTFPTSGNNFVGTLHAPKVSYWNYYYDTQWSQFLNFAEFDEPYENFYLQGDKVLDNETGEIRGKEDNNPDAEMGENSGFIVEDDIEQDLGDVDIEHDGTDGGSIIVDGEGCVNADGLHFRINVTGGRWYFFCFPFDVRSEDIVLENGAEWVFRYYDGAERAKNGKGGWKNVTSDGDGNHLKAATGYIFQCSEDDVLILTAKDKKIKKEKKYNELVEHITATPTMPAGTLWVTPT